MSRDLHLHTLERQRDQEAKLLRSQVKAVADTLQGLEQKPAQWVGEHPNLATAGAALLGFAAAQVLGRKSRPEQSGSRPAGAAPAPPSCPWPSAAPPSTRAAVISMLIGLLEQFLQALPVSQPEPPASSIRIACAGVVDGPFFPHAFAPTQQCPAPSTS